MDFNKAISLLHIEQACVRKADSGCDRQCAKCFLVRPTQDLLDMYSFVISNMEKLRDDDKRRDNLGNNSINTIDASYLDGTQIMLKETDNE